MKATVEGLEKERDFYFGKLRDIEVLCQEKEGEEFTTSILNILYATEVRNAFCMSYHSSMKRHIVQSI